MQAFQGIVSVVGFFPLGKRRKGPFLSPAGISSAFHIHPQKSQMFDRQSFYARGITIARFYAGETINARRPMNKKIIALMAATFVVFGASTAGAWKSFTRCCESALDSEERTEAAKVQSELGMTGAADALEVSVLNKTPGERADSGYTYRQLPLAPEG